MRGVIVTSTDYPTLTKGEYYSVWEEVEGYVECETEVLLLDNNNKYLWLDLDWECKYIKL